MRGRELLRFVMALCALTATAWISPAEARRVALIIGNSNYAHATQLANPAKDAELVADSARRAGFEVRLVNDLTMADFDTTLREFRKLADGAEVAMIYFAGHGIQNGGVNWLIPVDATLQEPRDLRFEAIDLDGLLETMIGAQLRMIVLDACRDNPFGDKWSGATRSIPRGLAERPQDGAMIIFAASAGQVATDGVGGNSPFARALAQRLPEPGLSIHRLGASIRSDVIRETNGAQTPWTSESIDGNEFYLVPATGQDGGAQPAGTSVASTGPTAADAASWRYYDSGGTAEDYRAYLREYPAGYWKRDAQQRLARLEGAQPVSGSPAAPAAAVTVKPAPTPPPSAQVVPAPKPLPAPATPARPAPAPAPAQVVTPVTPPANQPGGSAAMVNAMSDAVRDSAPLPLLQAAPRFPAQGYPTCREDWQAATDSLGRIARIDACLNQFSAYYQDTMNGFAASMIAHQQAITRQYQDEVGGQARFTPESQNRFYKAMMAEHAASNPDGANFADYRAAKQRYEADRAYLDDRRCASTGACGGYPVPPDIAPPPGKAPAKK